MSPRSKKEYREAVYLRYKNAPRHEKTAILDEFCATYGCHRKHAIRVLKKFKRFVKPKPKKIGKSISYQYKAIGKPLKEIWLAGYVELYDKLPLEVTNALLRISPPTIDRLLTPIRIHYTKRGRSTTKPGTLLRKQIPIKTN